MRARTTLRHRGFTLLEVLTVIAIIAILAAILFPVFNSVAEANRQARCTTNLKGIIQAMTLYRDDNNGVYPDGLYGVSYAGGPLELRLAQHYIQNREDLACPNAASSIRNSEQVVVPLNLTTGTPLTDRFGRQLGFAMRDTYSMQFRPNDPGGQPEAHYALKWTGPTVTGLADDPRQLYRKNPPGDTVVTFCVLHGIDGGGNPRNGQKAIVLFLNGRVGKLPVERFTAWPGPDGKYPWQVPQP